jgi:hypothetical protein
MLAYSIVVRREVSAIKKYKGSSWTPLSTSIWHARGATDARSISGIGQYRQKVSFLRGWRLIPGLKCTSRNFIHLKKKILPTTDLVGLEKPR